MAVVGVVVAAFDADPECIRRIPVAAQKSHVDALEHSLQRPMRGARTLANRLIPNQVEGLWMVTRSQVPQFVAGENGLREAVGEPEHFRGRAWGWVCVRVVEGAGWALEVHTKIAGVLKAGKRRKAKIRTQRGLKAGQVINVVRRGVLPVARAFGPAAIGRVGCHGELDGLKRLLHEALSAGGVFISDRQRAQRNATVANLVP